MRSLRWIPLPLGSDGRKLTLEKHVEILQKYGISRTKKVRLAWSITIQHQQQHHISSCHHVVDILLTFSISRGLKWLETPKTSSSLGLGRHCRIHGSRSHGRSERRDAPQSAKVLRLSLRYLVFGSLAPENSLTSLVHIFYHPFNFK